MNPIETRIRRLTHSTPAALALLAVGIACAMPAAGMEPGKLEPRIVAADASSDPKPLVKVESSNPLSGDPEAIDLGKRLYFTWCVQCHGPRANGESRFGKYAGNLTAFWRGYKEYVLVVKNGRVKKQMPPWKEVLDDDNIDKIGAFLETLAVEGANWK